MLLSWKHKSKSIKTPDKPFQLFAAQERCVSTKLWWGRQMQAREELATAPEETPSWMFAWIQAGIRAIAVPEVLRRTT